MKLGRKLLTIALMTMTLMGVLVTGANAAGDSASDPVEISTAQGLYDFLTNTTEVYGKLTKSVEYDTGTYGVMYITSEKDFNLAGYTITVPNDVAVKDHPINIKSGAIFTMYGGTFIAGKLDDEESATSTQTIGAKGVIGSTDYNYATVYVYDMVFYNAYCGNLCMHLNDVTSATITGCVFYCSVGGGVQNGSSGITMRDCEVYQEYANNWNSSAVAAQWTTNTVTNVYGGKYTNNGYGAYIYSSGGTVNIYGGDWQADIAVLRADSGYSAAVAAINVYDGSFDGKIAITQSSGSASINIYGGTFSNTGLTEAAFSAYVAEHCSVTTAGTSTSDYVFTVTADPYVATIGEEGFYSLADAITSAQSNTYCTIVLQEDVLDADIDMTVSHHYTIDLNGYTLSGSGEFITTAYYYSYPYTSISDLTITDSVGTGKLLIPTGASIVNNGYLELDCVVENNGTITNNTYLIDITADATFTNNGTLSNTYWICIYEGATLSNPGTVYNSGGFEYDYLPETEVFGSVAYYVSSWGGVDYYEFYPTLADAISDAGDGDTVTLVADTNESGIAIGKSITLDLNGCTLAFREGYGISNSDTLNIKDSVGDGLLNGTITNSGTIVISGGLFTATLNSDWAATGYEVTTEGAYNTVQPASTVKYTASGNTIYAKLNDETVGKLSILAPEDLVYDDSAKVASIYDENSGVLGTQTIVYTQDGVSCSTPTDAGTYTASITTQGVTASIAFVISKAPVTVSVSGNSFEAGRYVAPTYTLDPSVAYSVAYYDADGVEVDLSTAPADSYTIEVTLTSSNYYLSGTVGSVVVYEEVPTTYTVSFDTGAGNAVDAISGISTTVHTLPTPTTNYNQTFAGWSYDGKIYAAGAEFIQPEADVTMTALWNTNAIIEGYVYDNAGNTIGGATVQLTDSLKMNTMPEGYYIISNIPVGTYDMTVTYNDITTTRHVTITEGTTIDITMYDIDVSTSVVVEAGLSTTTVANLDALATTEAETADATEVSSVEIAVTIASANDDDALEAIAEASDAVGYIMDITVDMIVDTYEITPVSETFALLSFTIDLPVDMQGMAYYTVLRYHDDDVDTLKTSKNSDGEYIELVYTTIDDLDVVTGIIIHAKFFSTYAITSSETTPSTSSSSSGASTYTSTVASTSNGDVSISATKATSGTTITITTSPDDGYEVGSVSVTYSSGKEVSVTDNGDGTCSYLQPGAAVTVTVTFVSEDGDDSLFSDVSDDAYYYDAVIWAVENGITSGYSDGTFRPTTSCTRAQAVTFLYRAAGEPDVTGENPFSDVNTDAYYYNAVLWAVEMGITSGTGDGTTFSANAVCSRSQIATFMYRAAGEPAVDGSNPFADIDEDTYYYNAVLWAVSEGITTGTNDTAFSPNSDCTRGQIVTFLYRNLAE
ncbi:S-layer homology domain-containing protein [Bengtsoniella intestinalis]|uniref:S-layer homology domain-containing protein n=1 Tax=Bengtsoniella intestinalis TaxID=3073143 RepID=UPI00391F40F6